MGRDRVDVWLFADGFRMEKIAYVDRETEDPPSLVGFRGSVHIAIRCKSDYVKLYRYNTSANS
jgi:hypothetical protein